MQVARLEPLKVRENAVFAAHLNDGGRVIVRVHRLGYHSDDALESEHLWMSALAAVGIAVPRALYSRAGRAFEKIEVEGLPGARQVDVFEWIDGCQLGSVEQGLVAGAPVASTYGALGEIAARMHSAACAWSAPPGFRRHSWDAPGLVGESPFWGRFWDLEALTAEQRHFFERLRSYVAQDLASFGEGTDRFGLIHADLVPENVLATAEGLKVIDFDDAGYGWHLFEMATSLYFIRREPCYEEARAGLLEGYRRVRPLSASHERLLPLFLAARGTTYLGWVHTRRGEAVARELTPMLIELAVAAGEDYFATRQAPVIC
ncbi:MAG TPA: phosphotransferase [Steroidobacteraceae bacterium]|nr:phosphotransferase [Steroidobacteraceae bacterium]